MNDEEKYEKYYEKRPSEGRKESTELIQKDLKLAYLEKSVLKLQAQIEKMKCGENCKHLYHVNTGGCYDAKCDLNYLDCINCKNKWELAE